jgi:hypothetical protein
MAAMGYLCTPTPFAALLHPQLHRGGRVPGRHRGHYPAAHSAARPRALRGRARRRRVRDGRAGRVEARGGGRVLAACPPVAPLRAGRRRRAHPCHGRG